MKKLGKRDTHARNFAIKIHPTRFSVYGANLIRIPARIIKKVKKVFCVISTKKFHSNHFGVSLKVYSNEGRGADETPESIFNHLVNELNM